MEDIDTSYANTINPLFFNMRTWHLPSLPIFIPQFSHICDMFARRKFVEIHFFVKMNEIMERLIGMNISNLKSNIEIINFEIYV